MKRLLSAIREQGWGLLEWFVGYLPGPLGVSLRAGYWKLRLHKMGQRVRFGIGVRIYNPQWVQICDDCVIDDHVLIVAGPGNEEGRYIYYKTNTKFTARVGEVVIGNNVHIAQSVLLQGHGGLMIGNALTIAAGAKIFSFSHHYRDLTGTGEASTIWKFGSTVPPQEQALISSPVVIQDNAAVGLNSVVLPGSVIGKNSWLGAMSLLRGELPPGVIASGNPAVVIKERFT